MFVFVGVCKQQIGGNEEFKRCNYFKWYKEDNKDERMLILVDKRYKSIISKNLLWFLTNGLTC